MCGTRWCGSSTACRSGRCDCPGRRPAPICSDWSSTPYAAAEESVGGLVDLYRRVQAFANATIDDLPLDTRALVPWWAPERNDPTLEQLIKHVTTDLARHAGHADILREQIDGAVGLSPAHSNVPDYDWTTYLAELTALADRF